MSLGNYAGRARLSLHAPSAQSECDRCGVWWNLDALAKQFQWQGASLAWTGYLVCPKCLDIPFEQQKVLILPPDPVPRVNPRPSFDTTGFAIAGFPTPTSPQNQGMTQWALATAAPIAGTYPTTKAAVLSAVASLSGVPTPASITDQSITLTRGVAQTLLAANATRTWMLIYNPAQQVAEFALGSTAWNGQMNLAIGAGQAWFWANAQQLTPVYQGIVSAIGQFSGLPLWAWDTSAAPVGNFGNDGGVLYALTLPTGYQVGLAGLPAGSVYLVPNVLAGSEYAVGVVPGIVPNPSAPPIFFASTSTASLLALGGGNLPLTLQTPGSGQLWNNGGLVSVS
jgi:hypothetical protein